MADVMDSLLDALQPHQVDAMARRIGASPQQTGRAIEAALPLLLGQLARNGAQAPGAQSLQHALERDHVQAGSGGLLGVLGNILGGGAGARGRDAIGDGREILDHVFGARQPRVTHGVGQVGGINAQQSGQLLQMLAPLVMAALARMMQKRGGGEQGLGSVLGEESRELQQRGGGGLLGAVLDRDGDGDVDLSDLLRNGQLLGGLMGRR